MLHGHSGYHITANDDLVVKLSLGDKRKSDMLRAQAEKQRTFRNTVLRAPLVLEEFESADGESYGFAMERIFGTHPLACERPLHVYETLAAYIAQCVLTADFVHVPAEVFSSKLEEVYAAICANPVIQDPSAFLPAKDVCAHHFAAGAYLPLGEFHGDLTLCNVIVESHSEEVYLIDFLDRFIPSPLFDMVKLRQDTHHRWISLFTAADERALDFADDYFHSRFSVFDCYREHYAMASVLSLLRIVPYVTQPVVADFLLRAVKHAHATPYMRR